MITLTKDEERMIRLVISKGSTRHERQWVHAGRPWQHPELQNEIPLRTNAPAHWQRV